jgi:aspartate/methionine/tyrosine aminotransferase
MAFSRRTTWTARTNRWSTLRAEKQARDDALLDLTVSNPTSVGLQYPAEILQSLADPRAAEHEPHPLGLPSARHAIAESYGGGADPERMVLTASTSEAYAFLFKLLADAGDAVLVPRPGYPLFDFLGGLESVRMLGYPLDPEDGWSLDLDQMELCGSESARAVILVNPGNPTGVYLKQGEWTRLQELCRSRGWAVISDEVFSPYAMAPDSQRVECAAQHAGVLTFSLGGLSKWAGLPQLKLAWIRVGGPDALVEQALSRLEVIADTYLSVSTPVQWAAPRLLAAGASVQHSIRRRVQANREAAQGETVGSPCRLLPSEGGWSAVLHVPALRSSEEWALELLDRDGILVHPGYFYDFPREAFLVLSLLPRETGFTEGIRRLVARIRATSE